MGLGLIQDGETVQPNSNPAPEFHQRLEAALARTRDQREQNAGIAVQSNRVASRPGSRESPTTLASRTPSAYPPGYGPRTVPSPASNPQNQQSPATGRVTNLAAQPEHRRSVHFGQDNTSRAPTRLLLLAAYPPYVALSASAPPTHIHSNMGSISGHHNRPSAPMVHPAASAAPYVGAMSTIGGYQLPLLGAPSQVAASPDHTNLRDSLGISMILSIFDKCLGEDPDEPLPPYLKQIKLKAPDPFDGKDDNDAFNVWLENLLSYLDTLRLRGPDLDVQRIFFTRQCLTGEAAVWYQQTVTSPIRPVDRPMSHLESIIGLYRCFILTDQFAVAAREFASVRFEPHNGGVLRLYDRLVYYVERMFQPPTQQDIKERFVAALPVSIERELTISRGLHIRRDDFATFVSAAREIEEAMASFRLCRGHDGSQQRTSTSTPPRHSSASKGKYRADQPPSQQTPQPRPGGSGHRPERKGQLFRKDGRPHRQEAPRQRQSKLTPPNIGSSGGNNPNVKCFKCGGQGHISTDPKCPQYGKSGRMYAQRIVDVDDSDGEADGSTQQIVQQQGGPEDMPGEV
ncbi:hypothetical protein BD311DRAFT_807782 [Dichomitus squalens]|uniref:CCHC-type domain-containing protein n=1 Tax=Dichomitus squalens TaxID=114155 RepID=A0A4Q9MIQ2_9APHY|nr:hypothetical protein BD311DRAFT_807782 [Dichomitus squalens]